MKRTKYLLTGMWVALFCLPAQAQSQANDTTLTRTVVVEQEYTPDIMDAAKVNVLPQVKEPTVSQKAVEYDHTFLPAVQMPATYMQAYTTTEKQAKTRPGYLRLGYGIWGNLDARASYRLDLTDSDRLNIGFGMNGMDGGIKNDYLGGDDWDAYSYHSHAAIDYQHRFDRATLDLAGGIDLKNFNFMPGLTFGKQKFTTGGLHIGLASTTDDLPLQYRVETNLRLYTRQHDLLHDGLRETSVRTKADVWGDIDQTQQVGIAAEMSNLLYNQDAMKSYTTLTLTPYYHTQLGPWDIRLGANVDFGFGFGKKFRVSPDVSAERTFADSHIFYIHAKGGKRLNDFTRLGEVNPYLLLPVQLDATYETVNAQVGYKTCPITGLWLNVYAGYQHQEDELFMYGDDIAPAVAMPEYNSTPRLANIQNVHGGLEVSYDHRGMFGLTLSGEYRKWSAADSADKVVEKCKPAFVGHARADIHPISPLKLTVGFRYASKVEDRSRLLGEYTNLYVQGSYELFSDISIYTKAENLANTKNLAYYWGVPVQGAYFLGGVSFRF